MLYSIIIPVYNRANEVKELLDSLCAQTVKPFELLIIEDGSNERCDYLAQASSNGIKFDRLADGTLTPKNYEEVTPTFVPSDFVDKDEISNIVKNYLDMNLPAGIDKMTVMINKIKCELTKDGKLYVSPDEDNREEKAKKVQESLEILGDLVGHLVAMNASLIDFKKGADTSVEQKTTGSKTIPKFEVSNT